MNHLKSEPERVRRHTSEKVQRKIDDTIELNIRSYSAKPRASLDKRIEQLESEWDIERLLETNASTIALTGVLLGILLNRKWVLLSAGVLGFLLLHGVQGWCPPLPLLRRLGVRTRGEIDREKYALKYLRGDFNQVAGEAAGARIHSLREAVEA